MAAAVGVSCIGRVVEGFELHTVIFKEGVGWVIFKEDVGWGVQKEVVWVRKELTSAAFKSSIAGTPFSLHLDSAADVNAHSNGGRMT